MNAPLQARRLLHGRKVGVLATNSTRNPGWPYPAMMPYLADSSGRPVFLISTLAAHTQDLIADPRASLQVTAAVVEENPAQTPRMAVMGNVERVPDIELEAVTAAYIERFPEAQMWASFADFAFYRLEPMEIHYVGGFAAAAWVTPAGYLSAVG